MARPFSDSMLALFATTSAKYGNKVTGDQLKESADALGMAAPYNFLNNDSYKDTEGLYVLDAILNPSASAFKPLKPLKPFNPATAKVTPGDVEPAQVPEALSETNSDFVVRTIREEGFYVPSKSKDFVAFGGFTDIKKIIQSGKFFPVYITGPTGCGKSFEVEQACASCGRELFIVSVTSTTDEDDLLGSIHLVDGKTVWRHGPIVEAMIRGAVVLLDEVDLGGDRLLCLQSILAGQGVFLKKINEQITPAPGFTIIATANTKGRGDVTGSYIGTNNQNEAFLERFVVTMEQEYPSEETENKIVNKFFENRGVEQMDGERVSKWLVKWAQQTRESHTNGAVEDFITTRRVIHAAQTYTIFGNLKKSVQMVCTRYEPETQKALLTLFDSCKPADPSDVSAPVVAVTPAAGIPKNGDIREVQG